MVWNHSLLELNSKSNQIKKFILLHDFYKFWYTVTKIKCLSIYNGRSCVGRQLVRKPDISREDIKNKYIYNYKNKQIVTYIILIDDNVGSDLINGRIYK